MLRILRDAANDEQTRAECLSLSVTAALAGGDQYLARYFAKILAAEVPASPWTFPSCFRVASTAYAAGSYDAALELYRASVASADAGSAAPVQDIELALLRTAELLLYHERDASSAQAYFRRVVPANVPPTETPLLRAMRVRLVWGTLTPRDLGLPDGNVSALLVDQDDLWVGTWNGGVARYSVSARHSDSFPTPSSVRALGLAGHRVWVGGADGLSWYGKETATWGTVEAFKSPQPVQVQSIGFSGAVLYIGTLGSGLSRRTTDPPQGWTAVSDGSLPGSFVTCVEASRRESSLYIGTLSQGLVIMDQESGRMKTLASVIPQFSALNVTSVHEDALGKIWVATYGDGLFLWQPAQGTLERFTRSGGQLGDDYVMAICETDRAFYFGSFGGGVSTLSKQTGKWGRLGIRDGLASRDVSAIAWRAPYVFFGTLGAGVSVYNEEADGP